MSEVADTPEDLLEELKALLRWTGTIFGGPAQIRRPMPVVEWRRLRRWIRDLEALAVRFVQALAATLAPDPAATTPARPWTQPQLERAPPSTEHADSARWTGVRFRRPGERARRSGFSPSSRPAPARHLPSRPHWDGRRRSEGFRDALGLAIRLEALIRIAEKPERYVRRLLRARARPPRVRPPLRLEPPARPRIAPRITVLGAPRRPGSG